MAAKAQWGHVLLLTAVLVFLEVCAELLLRPINATNAYDARFLFGVLLYLLVAAIFGYTLRLQPESLAVINTLWQCLNIAVIYAIGIFVLNEKVKPLQTVGAVLATFAAFLMVVPEIFV